MATRDLRVLLVTSWDTPCGIAEHSARLKASVEQADPQIQIHPSSEALDPESDCVRSLYHDMAVAGVDVLHLNHHDGLHSRWTPEHVLRFTTHGIPVLVTYHDTRATLVECPKLEALAHVASSVVVHEPVEGLKAIYWRQGVPAAATYPAHYGGGYLGDAWQAGDRILRQPSWTAFPQQPVLGSVGFNFPWKNFDRLAQVTGEEGWALVLLSNNATVEDEARWRASNSSILVVRGFLPQETVVNYLAGCDATAFMYECANTGTSGAIRQGIAARKPVLALSACRQFRDLALEHGSGVRWVTDWPDFSRALRTVWPLAWDAPTVHLAQQESWTKLGQNYAQLYRMLAGDR